MVDLDGVVVVGAVEAVVGDVADVASTAAAAEVGLEVGLGTGPDLDTGAVGGAVQGVVVDVDVLYDVVAEGVLTERADGDAVRAKAGKALDDNVGAIGLEGYAVVVVVDPRVLYDDVVGAVGVPTVKVLGFVARWLSASTSRSRRLECHCCSQ